jgi:hypothetical protein
MGKGKSGAAAAGASGGGGQENAAAPSGAPAEGTGVDAAAPDGGVQPLEGGQGGGQRSGTATLVTIDVLNTLLSVQLAQQSALLVNMINARLVTIKTEITNENKESFESIQKQLT